VQKPDLSDIEDYSTVSVEKIKNGGRIIIPDFLRESNSFYFGKNVTVAGRGDHLKIMPRPS
jgi:DNA-binding transcriptional regulator/RsmH inhibitor MraZ